MAQANLDIRIRVKDDGSLIIDRVASNLDEAGKKATGFAAEASKAFQAMRGDLLEVWAAVELGGKALRMLKDFGGAFLDAARLAENYRTRLEVLLGSQKEAAQLFEDMREYAARVPFELKEIVGAAAQLAGVVRGGADEVTRLMPLIGDLAAASGLSIRETTSQVIRMWSAGAQAADMFRERGVLAMLGFQAGVSYSVEETRQKLMEAWEAPESRFRGATKRMASNWDGMVSMIEDKWFQFQTAVMDSGVFDALKVQTLEWDRVLADMLAPDGTLTKAADLVGRMADDFFGVTQLRGRIAAIGAEIEDLQGRLQGVPSERSGFLGVLGQEWAGTLGMNQAEIQARIGELQAERERLQKWLDAVTKARNERRRAGEGPAGGAAVPAGAPLWIDPTESAERWGELWAEKAWKARARAMKQLAESGPAPVTWIDPVEEADRWRELQDVTRARTAFNPMRSMKEVSEQQKAVIDEVTEKVRQAAEERRRIEEQEARNREMLWRNTTSVAQSIFGEYSSFFRQLYEDSGGQQEKYWRAFKRFAIAETIVSTATAAMNAYRALAGIPLVGPALGASAAASIAALGAAKVHLIEQQRPAKAFAEGGVVTGPVLGLVGEAGPEVVLPLDRLPQMVEKVTEKGPTIINNVSVGPVAANVSPETVAMIRRVLRAETPALVRAMIANDPATIALVRRRARG